MLKGVLDYADSLGNDVEYTLRFLRRVYGARTRVRNAIIKAEEEVIILNDPAKYVGRLRPSLTKEALQATKDIMAGNLLEALRENYEFDEPQYKKALVKALKDPGTYSIRFTGSGWSTIVRVDINLDKTAGRLPDWGRAISQAREQLGIKTDFKDTKKEQRAAQSASKGWARIFESRGGSQTKFAKTIRLRLSFSPTIAPFWELLDKGSVPLPSDRGGYPTPSPTRTNFVDGTKSSAETYMKTLLQEEKVKWEGLFEAYRVELDRATATLKGIDELVEEIRIERQAVNSLERRLDLHTREIDKDKLSIAVQKIKSGLLTNGSVELTAKGASRRTRRSVQAIARALLED